MYGCCTAHPWSPLSPIVLYLCWKCGSKLLGFHSCLLNHWNHLFGNPKSMTHATWSGPMSPTSIGSRASLASIFSLQLHHTMFLLPKVLANSSLQQTVAFLPSQVPQPCCRNLHFHSDLSQRQKTNWQHNWVTHQFTHWALCASKYNTFPRLTLMPMA
jgi:hypothetical protein